MNKINEILHKNRDENIDEILAFCHKYHDIYLYGSGCVGNQIKRYLLEESIQISGFIVSDGEREKNPLNDIPIFELSEIKRKETYGVIISTKRSSQKKIKQNLLRHNFKEEQIYEQKIYFQDSEEHSTLKKLILPQIATGSFFGYTNLDDLGVKYHTDKNHHQY